MKKQNLVEIYNQIVFVLLSIYILGCWTFFRYFAQFHVSLPFVKFPIFIGEILLAACLVFLFLRWKVAPWPLTNWHKLLTLFVGWILIKAALGYFVYGPLSFRNAALFYYSLFFVIGYYFFNKKIFSQGTLMGGMLIIVLIFKSIGPYNYAYFSYFVLYLVMLFYIRSVRIKIIFLALMFFSFSYKSFFFGPRTYLVATLVALIFLCGAILLNFLSVNKKLRVGVAVLFVIGILFSVYRYSNKAELSTIFGSQQMTELIKENKSRIQTVDKDFKPLPIKPQIYHDDQNEFKQDLLMRLKLIDDVKGTVEIAAEQMAQKRKESFLSRKVNEAMKRSVDQKKLDGVVIDENKLYSTILALDFKHIKNDEWKSGEIKKFVNEAIQSSIVVNDNSKELKTKQPIVETTALLEDSLYEGLEAYSQEIVHDDTGVQYSNSLFRFHIWKDMIEEIIEKRSWLGLSFGQPQRSKTIEMLMQAQEEWERDGWIAPHNSFLHMIYRGGIIGFVFILFLFGFVFYLFRKFIELKSIIGLLLVSMFVYWIVFSNALVILELPYNAIPFWTLLGMTFAYSQHISLKKKTQSV